MNNFKSTLVNFLYYFVAFFAVNCALNSLNGQIIDFKYIAIRSAVIAGVFILVKLIFDKIRN
jgi:hypothetical protein